MLIVQPWLTGSRCIQKFKFLFRVRNFHTCRNVAALPSPKVLRKKTQQEKLRSTSIPVTKIYDQEESLPPMHLLLSAKNSGVLEIEPTKAIEFLRRYQSLASNPIHGWESRLIKGMFDVSTTRSAPAY